MREKRRLALARRQLVLAQIARREAIAALGDAIAEEAKSANVAARSGQLVREYGQRPSPGGPAKLLQDHLTFVRSLQAIHEQAREAHEDALDQSRWQASTLAEAQARADRTEQRYAEAKRTLRKVLEQREETTFGRMARRLQSGSGDY
ncbi:MAG: hypothetical protein AAF697_03020 [Pseudomonadota bacterium]